jgi:hypothetical protein
VLTARYGLIAYMKDGFITVVESVYSAVRTDSLYKTESVSSLIVNPRPRCDNFRNVAKCNAGLAPDGGLSASSLSREGGAVVCADSELWTYWAGLAEVRCE